MNSAVPFDGETSRASTAVLPVLPHHAARPRRRERVRSAVAGSVHRMWVPVVLAVALAGGAVLRLVDLGAVGYNSDEAVYAGQGASLAGDTDLLPYFPVFRAHPLLFQTVLSLAFQDGVDEVRGRMLSAAVGVLTVLATYLLGSELYGRRVGLVAALVMAVMPYHVTVTRQVLLDGPMVLFATLALWLLARYARTRRPLALYLSAGVFGLAMLSKETSVVLLGSLYAFLALTPSLRVKLHHLLVSAVVLLLTVLPFPVSLMLAGSTSTGGNFLAWQLLRRPNHGMEFYVTMVPPALGWAVVALAAAGVWLLRATRTWQQTLLLCWITVPVVFFQAWPTKGFQYLLPIAPAVAVLAGRAVIELPDLLARRWPRARRWRPAAALALSLIMLGTLAVPSWQLTRAADRSTFLAGSGGVPGGREAGLWVRENVPVGSRMLTVGPSMANILQFYGHRKTYGLSVSPNPLHRNPVYEPVPNPDLMIRYNELQYLVWDSFSAGRSPFFSESLLRYIARYHGRVVHTQHVETRSPSGERVRTPVIVIYEVRP